MHIACNSYITKSHLSELSISSKNPKNPLLFFFLYFFFFRLSVSAFAMAAKPSRTQKKIQYDKNLCRLLGDYSQILVAGADNVGSNQLQNIRSGLRGHSIVLMGKNTMMKRSIRIHAENTGNKAVLNLIPLLVVRHTFYFWFCVFAIYI